MKNIKIMEGSYQVSFSMKDKRHGRSRSISVGTYESIKDAIKIRDFVSDLKSKSKSKILIKYDVLKLVNEIRKDMGYHPLRNSQTSNKVNI